MHSDWLFLIIPNSTCRYRVFSVTSQNSLSTILEDNHRNSRTRMLTRSRDVVAPWASKMVPT